MEQIKDRRIPPSERSALGFQSASGISHGWDLGTNDQVCPQSPQRPSEKSES